jgi:hypothetical protein
MVRPWDAGGGLSAVPGRRTIEPLRRRRDAGGYVPSVLFLPDQHYDHRIWADVPASLGVDVVLYDQHEPMPWVGQPMPWEQAGDSAFNDAVRRLAPGDSFDVVVAAGEAARLAFSVASLGLAKTVALCQPAPDRWLDDPRPDVPESELIHAGDWMIPVVGALQETDTERRRSLVIDAWRDRYGPHLTADDLELVLEVIGDHAEGILATTQRVAELAEAGVGVLLSEESWVERLGEIDVPIAVVVSRGAAWIGAALARRARHGQVITAAADTDLVWLQDRLTAVTTLRQLLTRVA